MRPATLEEATLLNAQAFTPRSVLVTTTAKCAGAISVSTAVIGCANAAAARELAARIGNHDLNAVSPRNPPLADIVLHQQAQVLGTLMAG